MVIVVDESAEEPIYLQIYRQVLAAVAAGRIAVGAALPSTRRLAADLSVNYHTVHRAYELLRLRGIISMPPRGKVVVARPDPLGPPPEWVAGWESGLRALIAEGVALGMAPGEVERRCRDLLDAVQRPV